MRVFDCSASLCLVRACLCAFVLCARWYFKSTGWLGLPLSVSCLCTCMCVCVFVVVYLRLSSCACLIQYSGSFFFVVLV